MCAITRLIIIIRISFKDTLNIPHKTGFGIKNKTHEKATQIATYPYCAANSKKEHINLSLDMLLSSARHELRALRTFSRKKYNYSHETMYLKEALKK